MHYLKITLDLITASFAVISAVFWFLSASVRVPANPSPMDENGVIGAQITVDDSNFIATAIKQTKWNRWAALAAGGAAICPALALMLAG
jgi:hypothetical protein